MLDATKVVDSAMGNDPDEIEITRLANLTTIEFERQRKAASEKLDLRASILDKLVAAKRAELGLDVADTKGQGRAVEFAEPAPWPDSVDGAELLDDIAAAIARHVVMADTARVRCVLWIVHTYLVDRFMVSPRLSVTSPEKRCGKSTLFNVIKRLVLRPLSSVNISPAAIYRTIELFGPTLLIDEADQLFADQTKGELIGILNSGHARGETVIRTVGDDHEPRMFATYCASAFAAIGALPDTIADRSIAVHLDRRLPGETITPFRLDRTSQLDELARRIARWVADHADAIAEADSDMPAGIRDREGDNWRPLLAIADSVGGEWPTRARAAAVHGRDAAADQGHLTVLLADIRAAFNAKGLKGDDEVPSADLVEALVEIEGHPWAEYGRARRPISTNQLARLLKRVGVAPESIWIPSAHKSGRGYKPVQFENAFERYLPDQGDSNREGARNADNTGTTRDSPTVRQDAASHFGKCQKPNSDGHSHTLTDEKGESGERRVYGGEI